MRQFTTLARRWIRLGHSFQMVLVGRRETKYRLRYDPSKFDFENLSCALGICRFWGEQPPPENSVSCWSIALPEVVLCGLKRCATPEKYH